MALWLQDMYKQCEFIPKAAQLLIREQSLGSLGRLKIFTDNNVNNICNVRIKPGCKNAKETPKKEHQLPVIAQENT